MTARGVTTVGDLRSRSVHDLRTNCWHWQGAKANGAPRIHTFDHTREEKRVMSGPLAVWNIAHGQAPGGLPFRRCTSTDCVNPAHLNLARTIGQMWAYIRNTGRLKGTHPEQRRAASLVGLAAQGRIPTAPEIVLAIRAAPPDVTSTALAARYDMHVQTVSRIRRGKSHKHLLQAA